MGTNILRSCFTKSVTIKAWIGLKSTGLQFSSQDVFFHDVLFISKLRGFTRIFNKKSMHKKTVPDLLLKSREKWTYTGEKRPDFAITPAAGQLSVRDFPRPPALVSERRTVKVQFEGQTIALSENAMAIRETASPPTFYVPPKDVNEALLVRIDGKTSVCEWKGASTKWTLKEQPRKAKAWS